MFSVVPAPLSMPQGVPPPSCDAVPASSSSAAEPPGPAAESLTAGAIPMRIVEITTAAIRAAPAGADLCSQMQSPLLGTTVTTYGVVTVSSAASGVAYIQDGEGPWGGIKVLLGTTAVPSPGQRVAVTGTISQSGTEGLFLSNVLPLQDLVDSLTARALLSPAPAPGSSLDLWLPDQCPLKATPRVTPWSLQGSLVSLPLQGGSDLPAGSPVAIASLVMDPSTGSPDAVGLVDYTGGQWVLTPLSAAALSQLDTQAGSNEVMAFDGPSPGPDPSSIFSTGPSSASAQQNPGIGPFASMQQGSRSGGMLAAPTRISDLIRTRQGPQGSAHWGAETPAESVHNGQLDAPAPEPDSTGYSSSIAAGGSRCPGQSLPDPALLAQNGSAVAIQGLVTAIRQTSGSGYAVFIQQGGSGAPWPQSAIEVDLGASAPPTVGSCVEAAGILTIDPAHPRRSFVSSGSIVMTLPAGTSGACQGVAPVQMPTSVFQQTPCTALGMGLDGTLIQLIPGVSGPSSSRRRGLLQATASSTTGVATYS